jgi:uncharacterized repeat protein (TIGR01451 family)/fimbrial isopeptide formation D2 family protein
MLGIYKSASKMVLATGDVMTYTIHLEVAWQTSYQADVTDPLPDGLDYVADSVNQSGSYDSATRTISWSKVAVASGAPVNLTFQVKDTATVTQPTPTVNTATITINGVALQRMAWVTLIPGTPAATGLLGSFKSALPFKLGPSELVTYTIHLINSGTAAATVSVSDPVPAPLTYVAGSASTGGVFDTTSKTVSWANVSVPTGTPVLLTFNASAPAVFQSMIHPSMVINTATITSDAGSFKRSTGIILVPEAQSPISGSFKSASQREVAPGDKLTYTVSLHNSSAAAVTATVTDVLPAEVTYVADSASAGGVYDDPTRTLTWTDLPVSEGSSVDLTYDVTINALTTPLPIPARIINTATITSADVTLKRSAVVMLMKTPGGDNTPPVVSSFTIGDQDVYTDPVVTLKTTATDNDKVSWMYVKEWALTTAPFPHWQEVKSSGWVPFQAEYPWTLTSTSGSHFVGVWVADASLNRSHLTRQSIDFASLVLPGAKIDQGQMIPYLVYYPAGVDVTATLNTTSGAADLFIWHPRNMFAPDHSTPTPSTNPQTITFTTKTAGVYMFLVYGKQASVFDLSISPAGGPRVGALASTAAASLSNLTLDHSLAADTAAQDGITFNPILPQSGLDPLSVAVDPPGNSGFVTYLPSVTH